MHLKILSSQTRTQVLERSARVNWSGLVQCGIICGAIVESSRSLKAIDERVFVNFRDKNAVFTHFRDKNAIFTSFRDKNYVFEIHDKNTVFGFTNFCSGKDQSIDCQSVLSIANLFYR